MHYCTLFVQYFVYFTQLNHIILLDASPGSYYVEKPLKNMEKQSAFLIHDFFTLSFDNDIF